MIIDTTCSAMERKMKEADLAVSTRFQKPGLLTFTLGDFELGDIKMTFSNAPVVFDCEVVFNGGVTFNDCVTYRGDNWQSIPQTDVKFAYITTN